MSKIQKKLQHIVVRQTHDNFIRIDSVKDFIALVKGGEKIEKITPENFIKIRSIC